MTYEDHEAVPPPPELDLDDLALAIPDALDSSVDVPVVESLVRSFFGPDDSVSVGISTVIRKISEIPVPSREENDRFAWDMRSDDPKVASAARERFILGNLRFVKDIAWGYIGRGLEIGDLIDAGAIGLICAVERFDPARGNSITTYAWWWIKQNIQRALMYEHRDKNGALTKDYDMIRTIKSYEGFLIQQLGRMPNDEDIAKISSIDLEEIQDVKKANQGVTSIDVPTGSSDSSSPSPLSDTIEDKGAEEPFEAAAASIKRDRVRAALANLPKLQRDVIELTFGFNTEGGVPVTYNEAGKTLGLSIHEVRELRLRALRSLRSLLKDFSDLAA